jgi:two-component system, cell cycle sensor histidine kinase and response regulator CckA
MPYPLQGYRRRGLFMASATLPPLRVLLLEDNRDHADLLARELKRAYALTHRRLDSALQLRQALNGGEWDIILSDYSMPQFTAMDALRILKESKKDIPLVVISGTIGEETAVEILRGGADDYMLKGNLKRLFPVVDRCLREAAERRLRRSAEEALRKSEVQLLQAQKMEAVGRLAGGVAHDFNNLLTAILGYTDLALRDLGPQGRCVAELTEVKKCGERAAALTSQLLAFSRRQVLQPRLMDLNVVVTEMNRMSRRLIGEDVELVMDLEPSLSKVLADPGQMEQVIMNLVVNARDAMPQGGKITLQTGRQELTAAAMEKFPEVRPGLYMRLTVRDTGEGMTDLVREKLFEPFFTTKGEGKGTGLGLAMVYGIVKQSGGHIEVESRLGHGAAFHVFLPPAGENDADSPLSELEAPVSTLEGTETILLVEDESTVRDLAHRVLSRHGYQVLGASNAGEAILLCEKNKGPIHLMLTDMIMPKMNGYELSKRLAPMFPEMKVLFMSGYVEPEVVRQATKDGKPVILKPFRPDALARKVREVLGQSLGSVLKP